MDDHRLSNDFINTKPSGQHRHLRFAFMREQRWQISRMIRMGSTGRVIMGTTVGKSLSGTFVPFMNMEGVKAVAGQSCHLGRYQNTATILAEMNNPF